MAKIISLRYMHVAKIISFAEILLLLPAQYRLKNATLKRWVIVGMCRKSYL